MLTCIHNPHWLFKLHMVKRIVFTNFQELQGRVGEEFKTRNYGHKRLLHNKIGVGTFSYRINSRLSFIRTL
jgi:hypothetical protein